MQKIVTFLMFEDRAEEAIAFYASVFGDHAEVLSPLSIKLFDHELYAYSGGPSFHFSTGMSLFIRCEDQAEVDHYWEKLGEGGQPGPCGWLQDRFGVSWQVVPRAFMELSSDPDPVKARRVVDAMLRMSKMDVAKLEAAYRGD